MSTNLNGQITQTLGSGLIGLIPCLSLYGITLSQTVLYFRRFPDDTKKLKTLVTLISIVDTLHIYMLCSIVWGTTVIGRLFQSAFFIQVPWQLAGSFVVSFIVTFVAQCFFCLRIWRFGPNNRIVMGVLFLAALGQLGGGIAFAVTFFGNGYSENSNQILNVSARVQLGSSLLCDVLISSCLVYYFYSHQDASKKTRTILQKLIIFSVNQGMLLGLVTIVTLVLFQKTTIVFLALPTHPILSKLYVNCLLATLNSRKNYRDIANQDISLSLISVSTHQ